MLNPAHFRVRSRPLRVQIQIQIQIIHMVNRYRYRYTHCTHSSLVFMTISPMFHIYRIMHYCLFHICQMKESELCLLACFLFGVCFLCLSLWLQQCSRIYASSHYMVIQPIIQRHKQTKACVCVYVCNIWQNVVSASLLIYKSLSLSSNRSLSASFCHSVS